MAVSPKRRYTYEDLLSFPEDGLRREIVDGELYVLPSPSLRHQRITGEMYHRFRLYLDTNGGGEVFMAPLDIYIAEDRVVEPDIIVVADDRRDILTEANIHGVPSLVIEVVSDRSHDLVRKAGALRVRRRPRVLTADPDTDRFEVYELVDSRYDPPRIVERDGTLSPRCLPAFSLDVRTAFAR